MNSQTITITDAFVIDTHTLIWYFLDDDSKLPAAVRSVLEDAEDGDVDIIVPPIVIAEAMYVAEKHRAAVTIDEVLALIEREQKFVVLPMDMAVLEEMVRIGPGLEMHDRIIAATARVFEAAVLTRDPAFDGIVETLWQGYET
jgi:predicted nucleic acid-binding protein